MCILRVEHQLPILWRVWLTLQARGVFLTELYFDLHLCVRVLQALRFKGSFLIIVGRLFASCVWLLHKKCLHKFPMRPFLSPLYL